MNNTEKQFLDLLSYSIRNKIPSKLYDNVDWSSLLELAKNHKVEGLIYWAINKGGYKQYINTEKYNELKTSVFFTGVRQNEGIYNVQEVLKKFNDLNISVIALKGLVIRNLYPHPEQRSMSDIDILVKKQDLSLAKKVVESFGYRNIYGEASHHSKYISSIYPTIELHWNVMKRDGFSSEIDIFEESIWKRTMEIKINNIQLLSLGYEDLALHLCMHMAAHVVATGFGVRQLCDLVLLVEKKGELINWNEFLRMAKEYGFYKFVLIIFTLCRKMFNMSIPDAIDITSVKDDENIEELVEIIFGGGVYGRADMVYDFSNQLAFDSENKSENSVLGLIKRYSKFIFPSVEQMSSKYNYAKKHKILIPIAWVHHLFQGLVNKRYSVKEKVNFIITGPSKSIKKNKLLQWMRLWQ